MYALLIKSISDAKTRSQIHCAWAKLELEKNPFFWRKHGLFLDNLLESKKFH